MLEAINTFSDKWMTKLVEKLTPSIITTFQIKKLTSDINVTGVITDLTFNNLTVGKIYKLSGSILGNTFGNGNINIIHNSLNIGNIRIFNMHIDNSFEYVFTASNSSVSFDMTVAAGNVLGNGTISETFAMLEELPNYVQTTQWN